MEAPADIPPIIATVSPPRRSQTPALCFAFVAAAIGVALLSSYFQISFPKCTFKTLTGFPCAFCGGTRALRAIGHLHFGEAFWLNPLVTVATFGAAASAIASSVAPQKFDQFIVQTKRWPILAISLSAIALNWLFVLKFLPR
jgi:hypothetical protein